MGPGEHRPHDHQYWQRPWATQLFAGDLFEAIPFADQPTRLVTEDEDGSAKHYVGEVAFAYGLLITPTCDMAYQQAGDQPSHPFRVLVPIVPLDLVVAEAGDVERSLGLLRGRDALTAYVYLPALDGVLDGEHVACLFRPSLVSDELLREPPRRIAQLQPEARRKLKVKLAAYWSRARVAARTFRCSNVTRTSSPPSSGRRVRTTCPSRS